MRRVGFGIAAGCAAVSARSLCDRVHATATNDIGIASYNILSATLCSEKNFPKCDKNDLDASVRLQRIQEKLEQQCKDGTAVIALQEVPLMWAGPITKFFEDRGYSFMYATYGSYFSNYMGVGIAWDRNQCHPEACEIARLTDTKEGPWDKAPKLSKFERFYNWLTGSKPPRHPWSEASWRKNEMVLAKFNHASTGKVFSVGTYHMPCLFGSDQARQVMNIHASLAAKKVHSFADGSPYVMLGDWNFKPEDSSYRLITEADLPKDAPEYPPPSEASPDWSVALAQPLRSAYVVANGEEPLFTNHCISTFGGAFTGTLDYIFLSPEWKVSSVGNVPNEVPDYSFPSSTEPSDHIMLSARLHL
eukprot:TRINITY_DN1537_c1_g1_i4.p1 TRINITY_DN1537_c1_g1~~TRINITY_DN1537_c1_g1_i4.p1  ORF type:complete len:361 (+),score=47.79 TRINITY_DN1537_c1_g1_i4:521-1603(+)